MSRAAAKNLMFKWKRKSYRRDLAPRAWRYVIDAATKQYARERDPEARWWRVLSPATRDIVSVWMTEEFERLADAGQFDVLVARKKPTPSAPRSVAAEPLAALFSPPRMLPPAPPAPAPAPLPEAPRRAYRWPLQPKVATASEVATAPARKPVREPVAAPPPAPPAPAAEEAWVPGSAVVKRRPAQVVQAVFEGPGTPPEQPPMLAEVISVEPLAPMPEVIVARRRAL